MSSNVASAVGKSNLASTKSGVTAPVLGGLQKLTREYFERIFPANTYKSVERFFDFKSPKTAENRMTGARGFNEEEIIGIICTQYGGRYLRAIMDALPEEQRPEWWLLIEPLMEITDAQKLIAAARSKTAKAIRRTVDADDEVSAAIRRAQSFSVSDPEFHSGTLAALGAVAGLLHRSVAQTKGKRK